MSQLLTGFATMIQPLPILLMIIGSSIGIVFGAIPGLNATMAIALFLPITFGIDPTLGFALLISLYIGGISGGLISAILIKIPGTPSSIATIFDGAPMARNGEAGRAISIGILYSALGTVFSFVFLVFLAEPIARFSLRFGNYEYFAVGIFALAMVSTLAGKSLLRGFTACVLGILFSMVGTSPVDGVKRFTFGINGLDGGFALVAVMVGIFAISEILQSAENVSIPEDMAQREYKMKGIGITFKEFKEQTINMIRSAFIGVGIGILPGIGGGTSNLISYAVAKNQSKYPEKFGTGIIDGVIASETANNASIGGALIPLFSLGIPGDTVTAILLGALMVHGLTPGPLLFTNNGPLVYGIFSAVLISTIIVFILELAGIKIFVKLLSIPKRILFPIIIVLSVVGAYGLNNRMFDVFTVLIFGIIGYLMQKSELPTSPFILGFILGPMIETNLVRALMISKGSVTDFFTRPISLVFLVLAFISFFIGIRNTIINNKIKNEV